jgi:hypothetical protein
MAAHLILNQKIEGSIPSPGAIPYRNKPRAKRSQIWKVSPERFAQIIKESGTIAEMLRVFGLTNKGGNYRTVLARIATDGLDISHIARGLRSGKGKKRGGVPALPLESILIEGSSFARVHLKARLIKEGVLENRCVVCGLGPEWNGKPLVMRLDHENGTSDDCRIENLRLVCPNCDSQLPTFAGRNFNSGVVQRQHGAL